jgi:hypothetical protein
MKHTTAHSIFAVTCAFALTATAHGDTIFQTTANGKITDGLNTPSASHVVTAGGTYHLRDKAFDSNAPSPHQPEQTNEGQYTNEDGGAHAELAHETGSEFEAKAQAYIGWDTKNWESKSSFATVKPVDSPAGKSETAKALASVTDPRTFQIALDPSGMPLFLNFSFSIGAGAMLGLTTGPGYTASASMSGSYQNSLIPGDMWSFSWSADSAHPGSSDFTFYSNPALGLDDAAIQSAFNAMVSGSGGQFSLTQDFTVSAQIAAPTLPGQSVFTFSMGGETDYNADASVVTAPEPNYSLLLGLILVCGPAILRRRL